MLLPIKYAEFVLLYNLCASVFKPYTYWKVNTQKSLKNQVLHFCIISNGVLNARAMLSCTKWRVGCMTMVVNGVQWISVLVFRPFKSSKRAAFQSLVKIYLILLSPPN